MTREQQRRIGSLKRAAEQAFEAGQPTLPATIWASADDLINAGIRGTVMLKDYTSEQRRRMAQEGRAMPDGSFPIADCSDAENAIHAVGRAKDPAATKKFIKRRVRALGCTGSVFDRWK
jgi:hypothetical protein